MIIEGFAENENFVGAINGTHLKIDKPVNDPDSYSVWKGFSKKSYLISCTDCMWSPKQY